MKIGYMGIPGSFSEVATRELIKAECYTNLAQASVDADATLENTVVPEPELVPLVCAANILEALQNGNVDLGVLGVENSSAGPVSEFVDTFGQVSYEHLDTYVLPIHHCLFKKSTDTPLTHLTTVASHPQALAQTTATRAANWPQLAEKSIDDTAIGAEWLSKGILPDTTAVICSRIAGEAWGLDLISENIEDSATNRTTFWLLRLL